MNNPIIITATVAAWLCSSYKPHQLLAAVKSGKAVEVASMLTLYGPASRKDFSDYIRVGEADITIRLMPHDEQVKLAVQALQKQLDEDRGKWLERQRQILEQIQNLSAISYEAGTA